MGTTESILANPDGQHPATGQPAAADYRSSRRPRPPVNVATLHGIVIGLPSSGKRSLLLRLEGKDPFRESDEHLPRIIVPYHAPGNTWGERIQLLVEIPSSFDQQPDFCVVLINPRHDPKSVKSYVLTLLSMLFESKMGPVSAFIFINFKDQEERSPPSRLFEEDVKKWIEEAKRKYSGSTTLPLIQTGVTSMKNCYGLNTLHHFIYQSYLNRKRRVLEEQLREVSEESKQSISVNHSTSYDEFLCILEGPRIQKPSKRQVIMGGETPAPLQQPASPVRRALPPRRKLVPVAATLVLPPKGVDTKKALDDFFGDDDSDDGIVPAQKSNKTDDDDEEDDFYYDDDGRRTGADEDEEDERAVQPPRRQTPQVNRTAVDTTDKKKHAVSEDKPKKDSAAKTGKKELRSTTKPKPKAAPDAGGDKEDVTTQEQKETRKVSAVNKEKVDDSVEEKGAEATKPKTGDGDEVVEEGGWDDDDDLDLDDDVVVVEPKVVNGVANDKPAANVDTSKDVNESVEDGWDDDDDLDLNDETDENEKTETTTPTVDDGVGWGDDDDLDLNDEIDENEKTEMTNPTVDDGVGWGDDDDLDLDDKPETSNKTPEPTNGDTGDDDDCGIDEAPEPQPETTPPETLEDDDHVIGDTQQQQTDVSSKATEDVDDDDDDFLIGESVLEQLSSMKELENAEDDDDEYMIGETSQHESAVKVESHVEGINGDNPVESSGEIDDQVKSESGATSDDSEQVTASPAKGGLNATVLAAIQAAEREAHLMLEQQMAAGEDKPKKLKNKNKKKKKEGEEKKTRKKSATATGELDD